MGARPLKRVMQKRILNELSKQILGNYITKDSVVMMELGNDGNLKFENVAIDTE
jgi:ATP-dependent Clp protease ATP-binding subunit ClpB